MMTLLLLNIIAENIDKILAIYGDEILKNQVSEILNNILQKGKLDQYSKSVIVCLKFKNNIHGYVWETTASKIESEINNSSFTIEHKSALLELSKNISRLGDNQRNILSETLCYIKDNNEENQIKTKAWETYQSLTENNIINEYRPPEQD